MDNKIYGVESARLYWQGWESSEVERAKKVKRISLARRRKLKEIYGHRASFTKRPFTLRQKWFSHPTSNLIIYGLNCVYECPYL